MDIQELTDGIITTKLSGNIRGISCDSRKIKRDYLFICFAKKHENYINDAVRNGARLIITNHPISVSCDVIIHYDPVLIYNKLISRFYKIKQPNFIAAVTGTNGKTSTVDFTRQLWSLLNYKSSSIGTLGTFIDNKLISKNILTTPNIEDLNNIIKNFDQDIEYLCLEASSHGIEQGRIASLNIKSAAFTNISHDHLDYHINFDHYLYTKQRLFSENLSRNGCAILNSDIAEFSILLDIVKKNKFNIITYGINNQSDVKLLYYHSTQHGHEVKIKVYDKIYESFFPVLGKFQLSNLLCAISIVISSGINFSTLPIENLYSPCGRLEKISDNVIVDYAHTPDALKNVLISVKEHMKKDIILVFGCGGNRDKKKRISMAKIAEQYSEIVIVTDDNPRDEEPEKIRRDIICHCCKAIEISCRYKAIKFAIDISVENKSMVIITGKGHEDTQIIHNKALKFNDIDVVKEILGNIK